MRFTIEIDETDAIAIRVALRQRSRALHSLADDCQQREPGEDTWRLYRDKGNELSSLADRIAPRDTDVSELISRPSQPPVE